MINSYKDLFVWQKSMDLVESIYRLTDQFPVREKFGLTSQMRRAAVSIPSNMTEGYGRQSTGSYLQFLTIARGSLFELETQIEICIRINYFQKEVVKLNAEIVEISKMISSLISKLHYCCVNKLSTPRHAELVSASRIDGTLKPSLPAGRKFRVTGLRQFDIDMTLLPNA